MAQDKEGVMTGLKAALGLAYTPHPRVVDEKTVKKIAADIDRMAAEAEKTVVTLKETRRPETVPDALRQIAEDL